MRGLCRCRNRGQKKPSARRAVTEEGEAPSRSLRASPSFSSRNSSPTNLTHARALPDEFASLQLIEWQFKPHELGTANAEDQIGRNEAASMKDISQSSDAKGQ